MHDAPTPHSRPAFRALARCLLVPLALLLGTGCADSDEELLNPDNLNLLWIAQSLEGRVTLAPGFTAVQDANVTFQISLDREFWFNFGSTRTGPNGDFRFSAAQPGNPANYWRLEAPGDLLQYPVYIRVTAGKSGVGSGEVNTSVVRKPSKSPPSGNLNPYQLLVNVIMNPLEQ